MTTSDSNDSLLPGALELFWRHGFQASSVTRLVHRTELNRHSLYALFGSKWGLAEAALEHYFQVLSDELTAVFRASACEPERLAEAWTRPREGSVLARVRERGCFAESLLAEARTLRPALLTRRGEPHLRLRRALGEALPSAQPARLDLLGALLQQALVPGTVHDLQAALSEAMPSGAPLRRLSTAL
ncbi:MAG: hypothetical protein DHS20C15_01470 [Planctomycetota bacterium]|nr:MAG: hypothetical protein DHS20C15_01470 [Planctomycetota bacterium]